jgi:multiple sugar transport system substrate-binding protein
MVAGAVLAAGCAQETGPPTLVWYINPDDGGQEELAEQCSEEADGAYQISTSLLPREAPGQREQLARRLAAGDEGIDLMSLDPAFIAEFAEAGWLTDIPPEVASEVTEDIVEPAVEVSTWRDELVAIPFWANTQLLWYRASVAEQAGLDDVDDGISWSELIDAAQSEDTLISVHGVREEAYAVWINALVESAGGSIVENPDAPAAEVELGLDTDAGKAAAEVIEAIAQDGLAGPGLANLDEEAAMHQFNSEASSFMVNWPFVWAAINGAVDEGTLEQDFLDDIAWAPYPSVGDGDPRPPFGGISIGISAFSNQPDEAIEAAQCLTSPDNQAEYFVNEGNPAAHTDAYDDPDVQDAFPMADLIRESLENAGLRPHTPYYNEVSEGLRTSWHPPADVNPERTPAESATFIIEVLRGERLL